MTEARGGGIQELGWNILVPVIIVVASLLLLACEPHTFFRDDMQTQHLPLSRDIARAMLSGEFPFASPYSWQGGAITGEYQSAVLSVTSVEVNIIAWTLPMSLPATTAFLSIVHLAVLAAGAFRLDEAEASALGPRPWSALSRHLGSLLPPGDGRVGSGELSVIPGGWNP